MSAGNGSVISTTERATRVLQWSLRVCGGIDLLAAVPFLMPTSWIHFGHELCGFGRFPTGPVPEYLARSTSLLWAVHGALLVYLSRDVRKEVAVIRFIAVVTIVAGVLLCGLAWQVGLPGWWVLMEGPVFAATGLWYLWWLRRC
jgi:hypothetical protein